MCVCLKNPHLPSEPVSVKSLKSGSAFPWVRLEARTRSCSAEVVEIILEGRIHSGTGNRLNGNVQRKTRLFSRESERQRDTPIKAYIDTQGCIPGGGYVSTSFAVGFLLFRL